VTARTTELYAVHFEAGQGVYVSQVLTISLPRISLTANELDIQLLGEVDMVFVRSDVPLVSACGPCTYSFFSSDYFCLEEAQLIVITPLSLNGREMDGCPAP
jgi:hypothetical protein